MAVLVTRYDVICRQLSELQDEYANIIKDEGGDCRIRELNRLRMYLKDRKWSVFGHMTYLVTPQADYEEKPGFKEMLHLQIDRLQNSTDQADVALLKYLQQTLKDKKYKPKNWRAEYEKIELAMAALDLAREKNISQSQAAMQISKSSNIPKRTIENEISKLKREEPRSHAEFMADFAEVTAQEYPSE